MSDAVPMTVTGVRVELPSNTPIVLLREQNGARFLPIWVGAVEATAIASAMENVVPPRPLTHDLLRSTIEALGASVSKVVVTALRDSVFYADLVFETPAGEVVVSSRPSDAIALAVRTGAPVFAAPEVLAEAAIELEDETAEEEIERFREFLDEVSPEDFEGSGES
jgi:uncharacterized protein